AATAALERAQKQRRDFLDSDAEREAKLTSKQGLEQSLRTVQASLATDRSELARLIVPDRKFDLQTFDDPDRRLLFAGIAAGLIGLLMMIPIGWNLVLLS